MARKKLGIIQIENIVCKLDGDFNSSSSTEITDVLTDEQKEIIKSALKGEKLVVLSNCKITDASDYELNIQLAIASINNNLIDIFATDRPEDTRYFLSIFMDSDDIYNIYS